MTASTPHDESVVAAMCAALERYPWRRLTPGLFARLALAANDRHTVQLLLEGVGGTEVGSWENLEPVHLEDDRVDRLVDFLAGQRWTTSPSPSCAATCTARSTPEVRRITRRR